MYKGKIKKYHVYFNELPSIKYFNHIEEGSYKVLNTLKSTKRSIVKLIEIDSKKLIYKIPIEKNTRKWQRFLSIFRGSESRREFQGIEKVLKNGLKSPQGYFVCETKKFGMVVDSYIIEEYIDGKIDKIENIEIVGKELAKIHEKGFFHGDPAMNNFIVKDNEVFTIDTKLPKNIFGRLIKSYEYIGLENSTGETIELKDYDKNSLYYKLAKSYDRYNKWLRKTKLEYREKKAQGNRRTVASENEKASTDEKIRNIFRNKKETSNEDTNNKA